MGESTGFVRGEMTTHLPMRMFVFTLILSEEKQYVS